MYIKPDGFYCRRSDEVLQPRACRGRVVLRRGTYKYWLAAVRYVGGFPPHPPPPFGKASNNIMNVPRTSADTRCNNVQSVQETNAAYSSGRDGTPRCMWPEEKIFSNLFKKKKKTHRICLFATRFSLKNQSYFSDWIIELQPHE